MSHNSVKHANLFVGKETPSYTALCADRLSSDRSQFPNGVAKPNEGKSMATYVINCIEIRR